MTGLPSASRAYCKFLTSVISGLIATPICQLAITAGQVASGKNSTQNLQQNVCISGANEQHLKEAPTCKLHDRKSNQLCKLGVIPFISLTVCTSDILLEKVCCTSHQSWTNLQQKQLESFLSCRASLNPTARLSVGRHITGKPSGFTKRKKCSANSTPKYIHVPFSGQAMQKHIRSKISYCSCFHQPIAGLLKLNLLGTLRWLCNLSFVSRYELFKVGIGPDQDERFGVEKILVGWTIGNFCATKRFFSIYILEDSQCVTPKSAREPVFILRWKNGLEHFVSSFTSRGMVWSFLVPLQCCALHVITGKWDETARL